MTSEEKKVCGERMKEMLSCKVMQDLILLYVNGECSDETKNLVVAHLTECAGCLHYYKMLSLPEEEMLVGKLPAGENLTDENHTGENHADENYTDRMLTEEVSVGEVTHDKMQTGGLQGQPLSDGQTGLTKEMEKRAALAVQKSIRKIKRRWRLSLVAALMILPVLLIGYLTLNQIQGQGICFTNLDDIYRVGKYMRLLKEGEYEQALKMMDFSDGYRSILQAFDEKMPLPIEIVVGDEVYYCYEDFAKQWIAPEYEWKRTDPEMADGRQETSPALWRIVVDASEEMEFWRYLLFNRVQGCMIPRETWEKLVGEHYVVCMDYDDREVYYPKDESGEWIPEYNGFYLLESVWGDYYSNWNVEEPDSAYKICIANSLIPAAIFEEALPEIESEYRQSEQWRYEHFGWVLNVTEEEYGNACREKYLERLKAYGKKQLELTGIRYRSAYGNVVEYSYAEVAQDGTRIEGWLGFQVKNGELVRSGGGTASIDGTQLEEVFTRIEP